MKLLELFAGSRSIGKQAEKLGFDVFSIDIFPFENIDLVMDIEFLTPEMIPFIPDVIWASPPCTTYSVAGISHHRSKEYNGDEIKIVNKTEFADKSDRLILKTLQLIKHYNSVYFIENPRGMLRKMNFMRGMPRVTVWYCRYGDKRAKPTDIWSNNISSIFNPNGWIPKPECHNNNIKCDHERAKRGARTGTQGLNGDYERSKIPDLLAEDILKSCLK